MFVTPAVRGWGRARDLFGVARLATGRPLRDGDIWRANQSTWGARGAEGEKADRGYAGAEKALTKKSRLQLPSLEVATC